MEKYEKPRMEVVEIEEELRTGDPCDFDSGTSTGITGDPINIGSGNS